LNAAATAIFDRLTEADIAEIRENHRKVCHPTLLCRITSCVAEFRTLEAISPNATFLCRLHDRRTEVQALGRMFDASVDYADRREHFQPHSHHDAPGLWRRKKLRSPYDKNSEWRAICKLAKRIGWDLNAADNETTEDLYIEDDTLRLAQEAETGEEEDLTPVSESARYEAGLNIVQGKSSSIETPQVEETVRTFRIFYDAFGNADINLVRGTLRSEHLYLFEHEFLELPQAEIASQHGTTEDAVAQGIKRARKEIATMNELLKKNPEISPADVDFYSYVSDLLEAESTKLIRSGGYFLFYDLNGLQLVPIQASDDKEAEQVLQAQYQKTLQNALNRFPRKTRERAREILLDAKDDLEKAAQELTAELPEFMEKYLAITEAFDKPGVIRLLDPAPEYAPPKT
jgi:hypothetical protein